mgnify:CR=1 FL=1
MARPRIDPEVLRALWLQDVPTSAIAERFGVQSPAVCRAAKLLGLPSRLGHSPRAPAKAPAKAAAPPPSSAIPTSPAMPSAGGITLRQSQLEMHRARARRPGPKS